MQRPQAEKELGTGEKLKEGQDDWHSLRETVAPDKTGNLGRKEKNWNLRC